MATCAKHGRPRGRPGLFDPAREHDACGVGFIVNIKNKPSHKIVQNGLEILENLEHRGAVGADPLMGDGAGIMVQIPHKFFARKRRGSASPCPAGRVRRRLHLHAAGRRPARQDGARRREGHRGRGPDPARLARRAVRQFLACPRRPRSPPPSRSTARSSSAAAGRRRRGAFERKLYIIRKVISAKIYSAYRRRADNDFYIVSMCCRTLVYKGMFLASQLGAYYTDLHDPDFESALALVHQRFSTNTFPQLAAGASLPDRLPQRRNQHRPRQRQLDGGAPGLGRPRRCSATTSRSSGRSPIRASPTPPASTTRSSSWCAAATRCRMRR